MLTAEARERLTRAVDFRGDTARVTVRRDDLRKAMAAMAERSATLAEAYDMGQQSARTEIVAQPGRRDVWYWLGVLSAASAAGLAGGFPLGWLAHG